MTLKLHAPVPEHAPAHPLNTDPDAGAADNVTVVGFVYDAAQVPDFTPLVDVQLILVCAGLLVPVTVPDPAPSIFTVASVGPAKVAVTDTGDVPMTKVQSPVPGQFTAALDQPAKVDPDGVACRVTVSPGPIAEVFVHVPDAAPAVTVHEIPNPVVSVTDPLPVPDPVTVTVVALNVAETDCAELIVMAHAPVPVHAPPQPVKADPAGVFAVKVTFVVSAN